MGNDVFYLTLEELLSHLNGEDVKAIDYIPQRRQTFERYRSYPRYPTLIRGRFDPAQWAANPNRRFDVYDTDSKLPAITTKNHIVHIPGAEYYGVLVGMYQCNIQCCEIVVIRPF